MEISFCDLRAKEVVNIFDGKALGHIIDMIIDTSCARVLGIVVPNEKSIFNIFKSTSDIFIPYHRICKIGKDVILVDLNTLNQGVKVLEENNKIKNNNHQINEQNISNNINTTYSNLSQNDNIFIKDSEVPQNLNNTQTENYYQNQNIPNYYAKNKNRLNIEN